MHCPTVLTVIGFLTVLTAAIPHPLMARASSGQNVVYWGQNGGGTIENACKGLRGLSEKKKIGARLCKRGPISETGKWR